MNRLTYPAIGGAALAAAMLLPIEPGWAMCGGNIFATCPPSPNAAAAQAAKAKRESRIQAVRAKKRHYPINTR